MCGICGILDYKTTSSVTESHIRSMNKAMAHRGPDDEGVYIDATAQPAIGLGHRRLSIIDLSASGHQPMCNEDGSVWICFNGEIYNYESLKITLEKKGHRFRSHTDTETIIHLYEEHGEDCVRYLQGMFAIAIWDKKEAKLVLYRDRAGKKPLLYSYKRGEFSFASEFTGLLASGLVQKTINHEAIYLYLTFGYIPAPLSIYTDVLKLPPGHKLVLKDQSIHISRYWDLDFSKKLDISEKEAQEEILSRLQEAVKKRLRSDVPLGAFLSGGIDSSAVVGLMAEASTEKINTFSIGFHDRDYSELHFAKIIAERFQTNHHEFMVKPDALHILPLLVERYGEPYADSSCIPTYYVAQQTKQFVTVALNGDGGDELFAGYERYQAMLLAHKLQKLPPNTLSLLQKCSLQLPDSLRGKSMTRKIKRFMQAAKLPLVPRYIRWIGIMDETLKLELCSDDFLQRSAATDPSLFITPYLENDRTKALIDRLLLTDTMTYLPNDLLVKVDITSMANSLEARSPFLDHNLMEFAASIPASYKMKHFIKKYMLKKAFGKLLPRQNITRKKMGFGMPVGSWFRNELKGFLKETLLSEQSLKRGYFKPEVVKHLVNAHIQGKHDYSFPLWSLLMLELWHKKFMDS